LYDTRRELDEFGVMDSTEATTVAQLLLAEKVDHGRLHAAIRPAIERFDALEEEEQDRFRDALGRFTRIYAFLSQVVTFGDIALERDFVFGRALQPFIRADPGEAVNLSGEVELTHLRNEQQFSGSVTLRSDEGEVSTIYSGTGRSSDPEAESLSAIIDRINATYGTDWSDADRLVFDAALEDLVNDNAVQRAAVNNSPENFGVVFPDYFQRALLGRMDRNEKVVFDYLDDSELRADLVKKYATLAQAKASVMYQAHCPIGELLAMPEGAHLEYKSSLRTSASTGDVMKALESVVIKSVAAFANSTDGGTLLIGVADDGSVHGLDTDYASLHKDGKDNRDVFELHLGQLMVQALGSAAAATLVIQLHTVDGHDVCRVHVPPSTFPVDATVTLVDNKDQHRKESKFYVRIGNATRAIDDPDERRKFVERRWGTSPATT
ncbi:MAG TPA: ATP-binding protein, partial [Jiangellaceae bacterium]|nr:ATP-binding protein [Jiangellaceae bacterium]